MATKRWWVPVVFVGGVAAFVAYGLRGDETLGSGDDTPPTFAKDIAPLVHRHCSPCHYDGGPGPFALLTFDDVVDHATQVAEVTGTGFMPPWLPADGFGNFEGARGLAPEEVAMLARWVEAGTPRGEGDPPDPPTFTPGWQLGSPDAELKTVGVYTVPADGLDVYRNFVVRVPDGPPRFVRAVELRPGDPKIVHHAVLRVDVEGEARRRDGEDGQIGFDGMIFAGARMPGGRFIGWTPGKAPDPGTDARSWRLIGGSDLVLQVHLRPSGKPESIEPRIGLHYAKSPPTKPALSMELSSTAIDIPPGKTDYAVHDRYTLPADTLVVSVYPHAHYIGKRLEGSALLPDGTRKWLVKIEDWDFNWQDQYRFERPVLLPKGTVVSMDFVYDNSAGNPRNPSSPPRRVVHGPASTDEMAELILEVEPARPQDYGLLDESFRRKWLAGQVATFERRLEDDPEDAETLATLAALQAQLGRPKQASALYERSLSLRDDPSTRVDLAIVLTGTESFDAAERELQRAIDSDPELARAHASLGALHRKRGGTAAAIASYERAVKLDASAADPHNNLGIAYEEAERFDDAAKGFRRAAELSPTRALFRENLGRALAAAAKPKDAIAAYRAALERDPNRFKSLYGLAWILATTSDATLRDPKEALRHAEHAAAITQNRSPEVLDALAAAQAGLGHHASAAQVASKAVELAGAAKREDLAGPIRKRLRLYEAGRDYVAP